MALPRVPAAHSSQGFAAEMPPIYESETPMGARESASGCGEVEQEFGKYVVDITNADADASAVDEGTHCELLTDRSIAMRDNLRESRSMPGLHSPNSSLGFVPRASTAPLIPCGMSPQMSTWHATGSAASSRAFQHRSWRPLGSRWREWESLSGSIRSNADDGREFIDGCLPHWRKESGMRMKGMIEHELTWAYYRMRRHEKHPQRQAVGEFLPQDAVNDKMRFGKGSQFQFWRDLRPPFFVLDMNRVDSSTNHPDGDLYNINFECSIEYFAERLMDVKNDNGTFNNKVSGVAQVRIPNGFPNEKRISIVSWGKPTLNVPNGGGMRDEVKAPKHVDPEMWSPLAGELGLKPGCDRMARTRIVTQETDQRISDKRKEVKVPHLQRLLLGPHASLPRMAKMQEHAAESTFQTSGNRSSLRSSLGGATGFSQGSPSGKRVRTHTIHTPAVGFVSYAG